MGKNKMYITGDTHGITSFYKLTMFDELHKELTREDFVVIAGDCGVVWSESTLQSRVSLYQSLKFTVLFVDGNHENFDLLEKYPVEIWNGGKVHKISENVIHLMRGQVFEIDGRKIFTFGGAESIDKEYRVDGETWWAREMPNESEFEEGMCNIEKCGGEVDYVITHTIDQNTVQFTSLVARNRRTAFVNLKLNCIDQMLKYQHWYFGHFHLDEQVAYNKTVLYDKIVPIEEGLSKTVEVEEFQDEEYMSACLKGAVKLAMESGKVSLRNIRKYLGVNIQTAEEILAVMKKKGYVDENSLAVLIDSAKFAEDFNEN